jgi:hypothetical protein
MILLVCAALAAGEPRWFGFENDVAEHGAAEFAGPVELFPTAAVVGGVGFEHLESANPDDARQDRATTLALARGGLVGRVGKHLELESELEVNAGPYGTSVWEGQAAISVRNQLLRLVLDDVVYDDRFVLEAGRITDPASLDYFSKNTADQLLTDSIARFPVLMAGFNRGQGLRATYTAFHGVTAGLTFNAGNPTSNTGTLMFGGTFPPFSRFYEVPASSVGKDASRFPLSSFHVMLLAPSLALDTHWVRAHAELQMVHADTNMNTAKDAPLEGFNVRAGLEATLLEGLGWDNKLVVFANGSRVENDVVKPDDLSKLQQDRYEAYVAGTGFDLDLWGRSGVGASVSVVREREPGRPPVLWQVANAGATWWWNDAFALALRGAYQQRCLDQDCSVDGVREVFLTARLVLDAPRKDQP